MLTGHLGTIHWAYSTSHVTGVEHMDTHSCTLSSDKYIYHLININDIFDTFIMKHEYERGKVLYVRKLQGTYNI